MMAIVRTAEATAESRSHRVTGREARKPGLVCWHLGQASRPRASTRQPAEIARARASASPSAAGSAWRPMQEPISHHAAGSRSWSPIAARCGFSAREMTSARALTPAPGAGRLAGGAAAASGREPVLLQNSVLGL
jgi:hypothetical protein